MNNEKNNNKKDEDNKKQEYKLKINLCEIIWERIIKDEFYIERYKDSLIIRIWRTILEYDDFLISKQVIVYNKTKTKLNAKIFKLIKAKNKVQKLKKLLSRFQKISSNYVYKL